MRGVGMEGEKSSAELRSIQDISGSNNEQDFQQQNQPKSSMPTIAGIILVIVGALIIANWVYFSTTPGIIESSINASGSDTMNITAEQLTAYFNICGLLAIGLSLFTIIGGLLAIRRQQFWFAAIGGILGIFALAPLFLFVPNILSLIGAVLIVRSRKEFR
jgi:hypothetical protein